MYEISPAPVPNPPSLGALFISSIATIRFKFSRPPPLKTLFISSIATARLRSSGFRPLIVSSFTPAIFISCTSLPRFSAIVSGTWNKGGQLESVLLIFILSFLHQAQVALYITPFLAHLIEVLLQIVHSAPLRHPSSNGNLGIKHNPSGKPDCSTSFTLKSILSKISSSTSSIFFSNSEFSLGGINIALITSFSVSFPLTVGISLQNFTSDFHSFRNLSCTSIPLYHVDPSTLFAISLLSWSKHLALYKGLNFSLSSGKRDLPTMNLYLVIACKMTDFINLYR